MLSEAQGGRKSPIYPRGTTSGSHYMPHFRVGQFGEYLGVAFVDGPEKLAPGESANATVALVYAERGVDYSPLVPGAPFSVLEGKKVIALGEVVHRWQSKQDWRS
jgi:hypothetical protein